MARALVKTISGTPEQLQAKGLQIGDIKHSLLDLATFQSVHGPSWVLANGDSIVGSDLQTLTGWTVAPDLRGVFLRGKDYGSGVNPDGDTALGTYQLDVSNLAFPYGDFGNGVGPGTTNSITPSVTISDDQLGASGLATSVNNANTAATESRPKNITVNYFIKINEE